MQILALETSTEAGSCALWRDGELIERSCPAGRSHSETLLPLVRELLAEGALTISQLDAIAFGVGPGAFTGLRVACGAAQGLAVSADLPLIPITSLEAMAAASGGKQVLALLDARMGEVYSAAYVASEVGWVVQGEIRVGTPVDIDFSAKTADWLACGNALKAYPVLAERAALAGLVVLPDILPDASWVARLAAPRLARGEGMDPAQAVPLYIRDKVAKTVAERLSEGGKA
ncbi:tRNA (adenosine(37)-N6)-threonylcarbamoyltransferase complex dimerization subunit type 1 TsaB [Azonexus sp.]|uniref:tRNA (adenosine(37)-N6)-threonylcarbamoyltransferase complex dimerization subunit type 1 TsaB n=1 Tax=Azonexus sp. TaxID=1872668 RepID=UPI0027BB1564|nr:tRNA (adenosine(37)-N6)-threonylcarbamoyltransferase complex dimerization subunit type 1 TsaB [Azonexus sp.]